ncbi:protein argonaute 4B [Ricinus communis]|uniref:Eukaryotic translation initiation factor 2c, putative n=1 Tax=Ricinus communis TaxID=3988 RepID=B9SN14_RICCO|nr:protein argonaute 4B [Ricinus communis]EEF35008.1 eukaryotic translation initiation factor 2c, putative [Ricinus communis]|eukprot:XP_002527383.1 protein argonaute 4B [Ricinus communis]
MEPPEEAEALPPPPPVVPADVVPIQLKPEPDNVPETTEKAIKPKRVPMSRRGNGSRGQRIELLTNHFKVGVNCDGGHFSHYSVALFYEDGRPVDSKGIGRKVIDKVRETYDSDLAGKDFAYDGEKSLFTVGSLPRNKMEFTVLLDDVSSNRINGSGSPVGNGSPNGSEKKRMKRVFHSKTYKVEISFAAKIPMQAIKAALRGQESENSQEAIRVLDIVLRQHAAKQGCLLVRQSFFHDDSRNYVDLDGGVLGCRGFHSSFRVSQGGLSLNIDGSTTTIIQPGPLIDFLLANQHVSTPFQIDWSKAKRTLKNLRIRVSPTNQEYRITGLSENLCKDQIFSMKSKGLNDGNCDDGMVDITVYEYFVNHRNIDLRYSGDLPCINVGRPKRPTFFPIELCSLLPLQRYTKALSVIQRSKLVESSRQKPQEKMKILADVMKSNNYGADPILRSCGITISSQFTQLEGRVLTAPRLKVGNGEDLIPRNARWTFNNKKFAEPARIENWAVVNFSARCDIRGLCRDLCRVGEMKGIMISPPEHVFEENPQFRHAPPPIRVEKMFEQIQPRFPDNPPRFLLSIFPDRKNSDIYGPWKRKNLAEFGIFNQCLCSPNRLSEMYVTNVLMKINAKLGGLNTFLAVEQSRNVPFVSKVPTIIFGMDVSHGSPGQSDVPSIAAVVSSRNWPLLSRYRASVHSQSPKVEMIDSLFKPEGKDDDGIIRELLLDFYRSSGQTKPAQIIIFRDGVSESQFNQVLNIELNQIIEACKFLDESWSPKFTVIVAQKNHHTKFFQLRSAENVPPGTVVDNGVCHPQSNDFYMCAHAGMIGTTRPTHYHVLLDEIGFSADDLQELIHSLSYVYQRSTSAVSVVAPVRYAHLAATQIRLFMKFEDMSETSSSHGGLTTSGPTPVPELPVLHQKVRSSMFFC